MRLHIPHVRYSSKTWGILERQNKVCAVVFMYLLYILWVIDHDAVWRCSEDWTCQYTEAKISL